MGGGDSSISGRQGGRTLCANKGGWEEENAEQGLDLDPTGLNEAPALKADVSRGPQDQEAQVARKKRRSSARVQTRSITGASLEVLHCSPFQSLAP